MARTPRFGARPRVAPDLTNAIVGMMREYEAQRERNVVDAWKNGGEFEGKKVTDEALLKFFGDKMNGLSPDDPLYVEAKNTRSQYEFAVRNSKQELSYAQGKVGDGAMASFYMREAKQHPVNSEMYRQLMKLAAQYRDRANVGRGGGGGGGRGGGGGGRSSTADRNNRIENPRPSEIGWTVVRNALLTAARQRGILQSGENPETTTETTGEGFGDLQAFEQDHGRFMDLVREVSTSPDYAEWRSAMTDYIQQFDPNFDGDFSMNGLMELRAAAAKGIDVRLQDAYQNGTKTQRNALEKEKTLIFKEGAVFVTVDPMEKYEEARLQWNRIVTDPDSSPLDIYKATLAYTAEVDSVQALFTEMSNQFGGADGDWAAVKAGRAFAEAQALRGNPDELAGGVTLWEESRGQITGRSSDPEDSDMFTTAEAVNTMFEQVGKLTDGSGEWAIVGLDADGNLTHDPKAVVYQDVLRKSDMEAAGLPVMYIGANAASLPMIDGEGRPALADVSGTLRAIIGAPVIAQPVGKPDASGRPPAETEFEAALGTRPDIGAMFTNPLTGKMTFSYFDATGVRRFVPLRGDYDLDGIPDALDPKAIDEEQGPFAMGTRMQRGPNGEFLIQFQMEGVRGRFDPATALNTIYYNPDLSGEMKRSVFQSGFLADRSHEDYAGFRKAPNPKTLEAALIAESGGNVDVYGAMKAEAEAYMQTQQRDLEAEQAFMERQRSADLDRQPVGVRPQTATTAETDFNRRALALLEATGDKTLTRIFEEQRARGADAKQLADFVRNATGQAMADASTPRLPRPEVGVSPTPPEIVGYKDDGRPIYGRPGTVRPQTGAPMPKPALPKPPGVGAPGAYRPAPPPPKPVAPKPVAPKPPPPPPTPAQTTAAGGGAPGAYRPPPPPPPLPLGPKPGEAPRAS